MTITLTHTLKRTGTTFAILNAAGTAVQTGLNLKDAMQLLTALNAPGVQTRQVHPKRMRHTR